MLPKEGGKERAYEPCRAVLFCRDFATRVDQIFS